MLNVTTFRKAPGKYFDEARKGKVMIQRGKELYVLMTMTQYISVYNEANAMHIQITHSQTVITPSISPGTVQCSEKPLDIQL